MGVIKFIANKHFYFDYVLYFDYAHFIFTTTTIIQNFFIKKKKN